MNLKNRMWANFGQVKESGKVRAFADFRRVENQAGERVGVAIAPRLGSLQTATPTAKGFIGDFLDTKKMGSNCMNYKYTGVISKKNAASKR